jgi:hypothetical protein
MALLIGMVLSIGCHKDTGLFDCSESGWCMSWTQPQHRTLRAIWGSDTTDVWAVGDAGTIVHFAGQRWELVAGGTTATLHDVNGRSSRDVWAVGDKGTILHYDGIAWSQVQSPSSLDLSALYVGAQGDVWAVGQAGQILYRAAGASGAFVMQDCGVSTWLTGIWGSGPEQIWAVGQKSTLCRWNGTAWIKQPDLQGRYSEGNLTHIWGTSTQSAWILSDADYLYHFQGSTWDELPCPGSLRSGWGKRKAMFVVGNHGTIKMYDGTGDYDFVCPLHSVRSGTEETLLGIWGSSAGAIWAVGSTGVILTYQSDAAGLREQD